MNELENELNKYKEVLLNSCRKETCYPKNRDKWAENNPLFGHCALVVAAVYEKFGGDVMRGIIEENGISHYWNKINGADYDLSASQFVNGEHIIKPEVSNIERILGNPETLERYQLFQKHIFETLNDDNMEIEK